MKAKLISKIFLLFICLCISASAVVAQKEPEAILIGEYEFQDGYSAFERMTEQLIFRLIQEPATTRGLIGITEKGDLGEKVKSVLSKHPRLKNKILYGFPDEVIVRPESHATFWLVPLDAKIPDLGCRIPVCVCPTLSIVGVESFESRTEHPTFTAKVKGGSQIDVGYTWKVSAGKIIEGQGTLMIKVNAEGAKGITATVEISGVCEECPREASFKTKIH